MNEHPLPFSLPGIMACRNFSDRNVRGAVSVPIRVEIIDARSCAYAHCLEWVFHFDDVLMMLLREQESNLLVGYSAAAIICLHPVQSGLHSPIASLSCENRTIFTDRPALMILFKLDGGTDRSRTCEAFPQPGNGLPRHLGHLVVPFRISRDYPLGCRGLKEMMP